MILTDNELAMIEQLTYISECVGEQAGISGFTGVNGGQNKKSIEQVLGCFDEEALKRLEGKGSLDVGILDPNTPEKYDKSFISCQEWAGIIRYLKHSRMKDMVLTETMVDVDGRTLAICFEDTSNPNEAIVAFRGTSGGLEWVDNVEGLNVPDTECQREALDFIERLSYDNITVTGHSKGGNKAMYVAIASDKIARCVAYDGQGFSQEFIDKYWAEIQERGRIITEYSLSTDYVHALLFPVPNSNQIYCRGYGVANVGEHHSSNSFFVTDNNGNIAMDETGNPMVVQSTEDESIIMLHEFTTFVINNADGQDKEQLIDFISELLVIVFAEDGTDSQIIIDYCLDNKESLALIIAYLVKYMEVNDISSQNLDKLISILGLGSLDEIFTVKVAGLNIIGLSGLIDFARKQLTDNDDDWWIRNVVLPAIKAIWAKDFKLDITAFWEAINSKVKNIDTSGGCRDAKPRVGLIRDFSLNVYNALLNSINNIEGIEKESVSFWESFKSEDWYSPLFIGIAVKGINAYFSKLTETNQQCKIRIQSVFDNVESVDNTIAARMSAHCQRMQNLNAYMMSISNNIG